MPLSVSLIQTRVRQGWGFSQYLRRNFYDDNCHTTAAALTYQSLFAVVPILVLVFVVLDSFSAGRELRESVETFIFSNIVPQNAGVVQEYLLSFTAQARNLGVTSLLFVVVTAFVMLHTIEKTFNQIWCIKEPRHGFQRFVMYWVILTLVAPFIALSIWVTGYVQSLMFLSEVVEFAKVLHFVPILIGGSMFTLVYVLVPNCEVPLRHALVGGFITALIFELAKLLFATIMAQSSIEAIYGTFAAAPIFLFWIYILWTIILLGAEVVKSLGAYRFEESQYVEEPLFQFVFLLELFYRAHQLGGVVRDKDIRKHASRIDMDKWTEYKSLLIDLQLIKVVEGGAMVLCRDLNRVSIWDLYSELPWQLPSLVKGDKGWEKKLSECFTVLYTNNRSALEGDLESLFKEV